MNKHKLPTKFLSVLLLVAMLLSYLPVMMAVSGAERGITNRVTDSSTMDAWKDFFLGETLSTKNAGAVWTDKSVFLDSQAFAGTGISMKDKDAFLVALSAIASNIMVTGMSYVPTDTMLVLDVSGSMNDNSGNNDVAEELVIAANASIHSLLSGNKYNRVGVVLYSGTSSSSTNDDAAILMLPLNRYTTASDGKYLTYTRSGDNENIGIDGDVVIEGTTTRPTSRTETVVGATYIQKGIVLAKDQFVASGNATTVTDPSFGTVKRMPVMVLMSDGAPSLGSTNFTNPGQYDLGTGSGTSAALGFVTQLTASYAKGLIEDKYDTDCLFYTLGLGVGNNSTAISVLDPDNSSASTAVNDFWTLYNDAAVDGTVTVRTENVEGGWQYINRDWVWVDGYTKYYNVTKISTPLEQNYVDKYFPVNDTNNLAQGLIDAFENIVNAIQLKSSYFPTLISNNPDVSGNVSFVDKIGKYMTVTDIKGILINNTLFSGAELAKNFKVGANGGDLGSPENPTELGNEMVWSVQERLGIADADTARTLIDLAYEHGQLSYTSDTEFSNYIGWYANAKGEFLGFWHEGITTMPDPSDPTLTDATRPAFIVKSYGYLGEVNEAQGVSESDMMYATVQVRQNIATGEEIVTFSVPAALIPIITYNVTLDENKKLTDLETSGADHPIRLVYEVALKDDINEINVSEKVSADYIANNTNPDGSVNFYTNQYEVDNTTGYGKVNTYAYFNPSRQNDRYYSTENTPIYTDTSGTLYKATSAPATSGTFYRAYTAYKKSGSTLTTETVYRQLSPDTLATAKAGDGNTWYIPAGDIYVNLDGYTVYKGGTSTEVSANNKTGTLKYTSVPFVDHTNHTVDEEGYDFYVGSTLGNNGKITLRPATGVKITKALAEGATATTEKFEFTVTHVGSTETASHDAIIVSADGKETETTVLFTNGKATVSLAPGEAIYIVGLTANDVYTVEEKETEKYLVSSVNNNTSTKTATLTAANAKIIEVNFVNEDRGTGTLTIAKVVHHNLGVDHTIPADLTFTVNVTLSGIGTANKTFTAKHTNGNVTSVTTNANGAFTVTLKHNEQVEILDLPAGTVAKVVEQTPGTGFTPSYIENGVAGDGVVTVNKGEIASVGVVNGYEAKEVYPINVIVKGDKILDGREWKDTDSFTFELQKFVDGEWKVVATDTATSTKKNLSFDSAFANAKYTETGIYYYRVTEVEPATGAIGGVSYDKTVHAFGVVVTDKDMDGSLEISEVRSYRESTKVTAPSGEDKNWNVDIDFTNKYSAAGSATVTVDLNKVVTNVGGSPLGALAGFKFALYNADGSVAYQSEATTDRGFARLVLTYTAAGTYKYTLKEIIPANVPKGWTYSTASVPVTVVVSDNGVGGFSAVIFTGDTQPENATSSLSTSFINVYDPADAELTLDVNKRLTGRSMAANEFTFEVRDANGRVVLTGKNAAALSGVASDVTFDTTLKFDRVGTFNFTVAETSTDGKGVTTDKTVYRITVTVTDNDGQLTASYSVMNVVGNTITFENTYSVEPIDYSIGGNKILRGKALLNNEFTFVLTEASDENGTVSAGAKTWEAKNFANGAFAFAAITYTKAGTYYYVVSEKSESPVSGITFDKTKYVVAVTVKDNGDGTFSVSKTVDKSASKDISFVNTYTAKPTSAELPGDKTLTGKVLGGGDFSFELYTSNASWEEVKNIETVSNDKNGAFKFSTLSFEKAGTYYYVVKEAHAGEVIDGVTYDDTHYHIMIVVTDDYRGQLHSVVHIYDNNGIPKNKIEFVNSYEIDKNSQAEVVLSGNKTLTGKDLVDGVFTFELYETGADFAVSGTPKTATNVGGKFAFALDYTADDAGKTFYYVVKEANAGQTIHGVTYSSVVYQITVKVLDDGKGGIKTEVSVNNGATASTLNFTNTYEVSGDAYETVVLSGNKTLTGKDLVDGTFRFELYTAGADFAAGDLLKATRNTNGRYAFALEFTDADIGKTFYYVVKEANAGQTINGITYSATVYQITVKVEDNGQGGIKTEVSVNNGATASTLNFANSYKIADDAKTSVSLRGHKYLMGKDLVDGAFTFELYATESNFTVSGAPKTATNVGGRYGFTVEYTAADVGKTFYYVVKEANGGKTIDGITYSSAVYQIVVEIEDDGYGGIRAVVAISNHATNTTLDFTNIYSVSDNASADVTLSGNKTLAGKDLADGAFTFELYATESNFAVSGSPKTAVNKNGKFSFGLNYTGKDIGKTFYYVVKEADGGKTIDGVTYSSAVYQVTVKILDDGKGGIRTEVSVNNGATASTLDFTNAYGVDENAKTSVTLSGNKTLLGKALADSAFTFELYTAADNDFAISGTPKTAVNKNAKFSFTIDYTAADAGKTFYYVVKEADGGKTIDGIKYSSTVYHVTVKILDDGKGGVKAEVSVNNDATESTLNFTNVYEVSSGASANVILSGNKTLVGKELTDGAFAFQLYTTGADFAASGAHKTTNNINGKFAFALSYTAADAGKTFYYVVKEADGGKTINGITYSSAVYKITVKVLDDGKGGIKTEVSTDTGAAPDALNFVNEYKVSDDASAEVTINGNKTLVGRPVADSEFAFLIYSANNEFVVGSGVTPVRVVNGADGSFAFENIKFSKAGTYYFVIVEDITVDAENVTFDASVYHVTVEVKDNGIGGLTASDPIITKKGSTEAVEAVQFTNVYTVPTPPENPETGDNTLWMWLVMILISGIAVVGAAANSQKKRRIED
ncbi:MAG: hypothetical protein J6M35_04945 [Clostridia bacterium]|nr:hypothetical protein [Clostridia bacterium]